MVVRPLEEPKAERRGPHPMLGLALLFVAVGAVMVAVFATDAEVGSDEEPPDIDEVESVANVLATLREFELALVEDRPVAAAAMISDLSPGIWLPAVEASPLHPADNVGLESALRFFSAIADLDLGSCAVSPSGGRYGHRIVCSDVSFNSDYLDAVRADDKPVTIEFIVGTSGIYSMTHDLGGVGADADRRDSFCVWSELNESSTAAGLFDLDCSPTQTLSTGPTLERLAAGYLRDGGAILEPDELATRRGAPMVAELLAGWNGAPLDLDDVFVADFPLSTFPGTVTDAVTSPLPTMHDVADFLGAVYDIGLDDCRVLLRDAPQDLAWVECPGLTLSGPLPAALGTGPVPQPMTFLVRSDGLVALFESTNPRLLHAYRVFCGWVEDFRPQAALALGPGCTPVYDAAGAAHLLDLVADYAPFAAARLAASTGPGATGHLGVR